jgi:hypothetical protein
MRYAIFVDGVATGQCHDTMQRAADAVDRQHVLDGRNVLIVDFEANEPGQFNAWCVMHCTIFNALVLEAFHFHL